MKTKLDVEAAIKCLRIANRDGHDLAMMNLAVAVALTALGVPKEEVMAEAKKGQENRRKQREKQNPLLNRPPPRPLTSNHTYQRAGKPIIPEGRAEALMNKDGTPLLRNRPSNRYPQLTCNKDGKPCSFPSCMPCDEPRNGMVPVKAVVLPIGEAPGQPEKKAGKALDVKKVAAALGADAVSAWVQQWTESEAGWGQRPDGFTVHHKREDIDAFVREMRAGETEGQPANYVPECYSRPEGEPFQYMLDPKLLPEKDSNGCWLPSDWYPENADQLPLGWRRMKPK